MRQDFGIGKSTTDVIFHFIADPVCDTQSHVGRKLKVELDE